MTNIKYSKRFKLRNGERIKVLSVTKHCLIKMT